MSDDTMSGDTERIKPEAFTGYNCPNCPAWSTDEETARTHCRCGWDQCEDLKRSGYVYCDAHLKQSQDARETEAAANMEVVAYEGGKVFGLGDHFEDLTALMEHAHDEGCIDDIGIVNPCVTYTLGVPDVIEIVELEWHESAGWQESPKLSKEAAAAADAFMALAKAEAPEVWEANESKRIRSEDLVSPWNADGSVKAEFSS